MNYLTVFPTVWLWLPLLKHASAKIPKAMTWSSSSFGPDGPWNAITVYLGTHEAELALYTGSVWTSYVLLDTICKNTTLSSNCYAEDAGVFTPLGSYTWDNTSVTLEPRMTWTNFQWGVSDAVPLRAFTYRALDTVNIGGLQTSNSNIVALEQGYLTYPSGKSYPLEVGLLSLGALDINQKFSNYMGPAVNGTSVPGAIYEQGEIPSYSFGMHIGSPSLHIPGSLYLGGYDQKRAIGEVSVQPIDNKVLPIVLLDIGIGVVEGGSVWGNSKITGLIAKSNASLSSDMIVDVDATNPYIYPPRSTCDLIVANLPVTYHKDLGLYIWDTNNENYSKIITSPSYLALTFVKNGLNTEKLTIKIAFALLNLTLTAPLTEVETPYFPLMPTDGKPVLGRAFLQATFYGVHWLQKSWFLAQAPGPDSSFLRNVVDIKPDKTVITGTKDSWEATWASFWTLLPSPDSLNGTEMIPSTSPKISPKERSTFALPTSAIVGIGAGGGAVALVSIMLIGWFYLRRRRKAKFAAVRVPPRNVSPAHTSPRYQREFLPLKLGAGKRDTWHELDNEVVPRSRRKNFGVPQHGPFVYVSSPARPQNGLVSPLS
ncbi:hypothetical protein POX_g09365 [Penicillium oxalicum]|uniref:hypothetical protein n=1 Tax=Penicillium oxalicum TaxID=69781 RepID=UPI0020B8233E|nr:hypothetical protein POX_g09365 [Penicillium oxalicum]KAI2786968.1 hypothetical protein POX_g09365 [Penicillium oxalicum]